MKTLKELRKANYFYCSDIAKLLGVSESYINKIENGKRYLNEKYAEQLSQIFKCSKDEILALCTKRGNYER